MPELTNVELSAEQRAQLEAVVQERVNLQFQQMVEQEQRKNHILEFTRTVTGKGLPVQGEDLTAFLSTLTPDQLERAEAIFSKVAEVGKLDFSERGHSRAQSGNRELPANMRASLNAWLDFGEKIEEFFRVNAVELGAQADYNLTEYQSNGANNG